MPSRDHGLGRGGGRRRRRRVAACLARAGVAAGVGLAREVYHDTLAALALRLRGLGAQAAGAGVLALAGTALVAALARLGLARLGLLGLDLLRGGRRAHGEGVELRADSAIVDGRQRVGRRGLIWDDPLRARGLRAGHCKRSL